MSLTLTESEELELLELERQRALAQGGQPQPQDRGIVGTAWETLKQPEILTERGLRSIAAGLEPGRTIELPSIGGKQLGVMPIPGLTGNLPLDFAKGTPQVLTEAAADVAPSFVSPESILTAGTFRGVKAIGPVIKAIKAVGGKAAQTAEAISGLEYRTPGILKEAAKTPKLFFEKGRKAAKPLYEAAKSNLETAKGTFAGMYKPEQIIDKTLAIFKEGSDKFLTPQEALQARKAVDKLMKSGGYVKDELIGLRKKLDKIAKINLDIAKADEIYERGLKANALRTVFPTNKRGDTSIAKLFLGGLPGALGTVIGEKKGESALKGTLPILAMSPFVHGLGATAIGAGARAIGGRPIGVGSAVGAAISQIRRKNRK